MDSLLKRGVIMFTKLGDIEVRFNELEQLINDPSVISDQNRWRKLMKEHSDLSEIVEFYFKYKAINEAIEEGKEMLKEKLDDDFLSLVKEELKENNNELEIIKETLKSLLLPKDPNDSKNVIVEVRGGAGGDEANLFCGDLFRMYTRLAERSGFKTEIMSSNPSDVGGFKEISFLIKGDGAYSKLKYESGVHRVQRIPTTDSGGRIHTSTVTVAVLPEVEEVDVDLNMNDIRVDVFRSSGNGGQSVNTTDSAVRITHEPSGIVISCQDGKSQLKNKEKALKILRARLYDAELEKQHSEQSAERKSQVGTGDRSERIRTYNFPQSRVTDHRVGLTLHKLDQILDGELTEIIDTLIVADQSEKIKNSNL